MKWNEMKWNEMKWNEMKSNQIKSNQIKSNDRGWDFHAASNQHPGPKEISFIDERCRKTKW